MMITHKKFQVPIFWDKEKTNKQTNKQTNKYCQVGTTPSALNFDNLSLPYPNPKVGWYFFFAY